MIPQLYQREPAGKAARSVMFTLDGKPLEACSPRGEIRVWSPGVRYEFDGRWHTVYVDLVGFEVLEVTHPPEDRSSFSEVVIPAAEVPWDVPPPMDWGVKS
jgi:hypothetical protein